MSPLSPTDRDATLALPYLPAGAGVALRTVAAKLRETVSVIDVGAVGDGATDDTAAIQAALDAAAAAGGGIVTLPARTFRLATPLVLPSRVQLVGTGRGSILQAAPGFPGPWVVRLGAGTRIVFNCRLENLTVDCAGGLATGIYSTEVNEQSGVCRVLVSGVRGIGIEIGGSGAQNFTLTDGEIYFAAGVDCSAAIGLFLNAPGAGFTVNRYTVNGSGASVAPTTLIKARVNAGVFTDLHVEHGTNGLTFGSDTFASNGFVVNGISGGPNLTHVVRILATAGVTQGFALAGMSRWTATNTLTDDDRGRTLTDFVVPAYSVGLGTTPPVWAVGTNALWFAGLQVLADNAAALAAGLQVGQVYRTGDLVKVVH